jgi:hypothetical protein
MSFSLTDEVRARLLLWIEALESGEYEQGTGLLEYVEEGSEVTRRCCLGVLCRVAVNNGLDLPQTRLQRRNSSEVMVSLTGFGGNMVTGALPNEVYQWMPGLRKSLVEIGLINMNDSQGKTFVEIASHLRNLFDMPKVG